MGTSFMFRSIRWTFLAWLAVILVIVMVGFSVTLFSFFRHTKLEGIDGALEGSAYAMMAKMDHPRLQGGRGELNPGMMRKFRHPEGRDGRRGGPPRWPKKDRSDDRLDDRHFDRSSMPDRVLRQYYADKARSIEIPDAFLSDLDSPQHGHSYFIIWHRDGEVFRRSKVPPELTLPENPALDDGVQIRQEGVLREAVLAGENDLCILVGTSIEDELAEIGRFSIILWITGASLLFLGLMGGWFLAWRAVKPIEKISAAAESISASNLSSRINIASAKSELGSLAKVLNTTFDRLEHAFDRQARFTADASHELRTPVSVVLAQTDMALRRDRSPEEYLSVINACNAAAKRMKGLVDCLLILARVDSGCLVGDRRQVDLKDIVEETVKHLRPSAKERGVVLKSDLKKAKVVGEERLLGRLVSNLVTNAIRYNRAQGEVLVSLSNTGPRTLLTVQDNGPGIPGEKLPRIFDRFYRVDEARETKSGGTGLGLAIAKAIVEAHGGTITCQSELEQGTTFTVKLPAPAYAPEEENPKPSPEEEMPASSPDDARQGD